MGPPPRPRASALAVAGSLAAHAAALLSISLVQAPRAMTAEPQLTTIEVMLEEHTRSTTRPTEPMTRPLSQESPLAPPRRASPVTSVRRAATRERPVAPPPTEPAPPGADLEPAASPASRAHDARAAREHAWTLIDPSTSVARIFVPQGDGPSSPRAAQAPGTGDLAPRSAAEVERELDASMRAQAMTKAHTIRQPRELRHRADGSYEYRSAGFVAVITPDGDVEYEERAPVEVDLARGSATFDINDAFVRMQGQDPYFAERMAFEEEHGELIDRLASDARARRSASAVRRLRGQLVRLWQDESRPAAQRRRAILELWSEMDEGPSGDAARAAVLEFVREPCRRAARTHSRPTSYDGRTRAHVARSRGTRGRGERGLSLRGAASRTLDPTGANRSPDSIAPDAADANRSLSSFAMVSALATAVC